MNADPATDESYTDCNSNNTTAQVKTPQIAALDEQRVMIRYGDTLLLTIDRIAHPEGGASGDLRSYITRGYCTKKEQDVLETFILALVCAGVTDKHALSEALETTLNTLAI